MVTRALCRPIYRLPSSIDGTCAARRHEKLTRFSGAEYPGDEPGRSEVRDVQEQTRTLQGESETNRGGVRHGMFWFRAQEHPDFDAIRDAYADGVLLASLASKAADL